MHVTLDAADLTGSHEYVVLTITARTRQDCTRELYAQLSDGIFENCRTGKIDLLMSRPVPGKVTAVWRGRR